MTPQSTVHPVHFEDFDGHLFERLVFAYLLRTGDWLSLDWYGQGGGDSGRDIWGIRKSDGHKVCIACANHKSMRIKKIEDDLIKVLACSNGKPDVYIAVCGGRVSADLRDKATELYLKHQISVGEVWSGVDFEERLRRDAESLLKRFVEGEVFPDTPDELREFVTSGAVSVTSVKHHQFDIQFFDSTDSKPLGKSIEKTTIELIIPPSSEIPDYGVRHIKVAENVWMKDTSLLSMSNNENYYRELASYYKAWVNVQQVNFSITNNGTISAKNIDIEMQLQDKANILTVRETSDMPDEPVKDRMRGYMFGSAALNRLNSDIHVSRGQDKWTVEIHCGNLQPKKSFQTTSGLFIGSKDETEVKVDVSIYADDLPDPVQSELTIALYREVRDVTLDELLNIMEGNKNND